jgi:DNA-binding MarR family transcriptional regulator
VRVQEAADQGPDPDRSRLADPAGLLTDVVPRLYRVLRAALDEDPALPSLEQLRVMSRIEEGVHHASALASARQMRISAITPLIEGLARRGWVSRRPEPGDRRRIRLELTAAGRRALDAGRLRTGDRLRDVLRHGGSDEASIDVAAVAAWLERAVRGYDDERLGRTPPGD